MNRTIGPVNGPDKTYVAEGPITAGCAVTAGATQQGCLQVSVAGQRVIGIANQTVPAGSPVRVTRAGDALGIAGGAVTHGQYLKATATGHLIAIAGAAGSGEEVAGRAESDGVSDGDELIVFVHPFVN